MPPREYGARPVDHEALDPDDIYNDGGEESLSPCSDTYKAEFKNDLPHIDTMPGSNRPVQATGMKGTVMTQSNDPKKSNRLGTVSAHSSAARDGSGPRIPAKRMAEDHQERGESQSQQPPGLAASEGPPAKKKKGPARKKKGLAKKIGPAKKKKGKSLPEPQTPPTADNEEEEEFDAERIVDKLEESGDEEPWYRVRWVGHNPEDDTWELEPTLGKVRGLIEDFERASTA